MINEKILPVGYGSIPHFSISKLDMQADKKVTPEIEYRFTVKKKDKLDLIIVEEKVDGCNMSIFKKYDNVVSIMKPGFAASTSKHKQARLFEKYLEKYKKKFLEMLNNGEKLSGDWMIKTHTLQYNLPHEPYIVFDIIDINKQHKASGRHHRILFNEFMERCEKFDVVTPGIVHVGDAILIEDAMIKLGRGSHGCLAQPEGLVYRCEREGKVILMAKYVRPMENEIGCYMNDETMYNKYIGGKYE